MAAPSRDRVVRVLAAARFVVGIGVVLFPCAAVRLFTGRAGDTPAARLFARGFGARDAAIGAGMLTGPPLPWLAAAGAADAADSLAVLAGWHRLEPRHRAVALVASMTPMLIEVTVLSARCSWKTTSETVFAETNA
jgi:hypothetical protein